MRTRQCVAIARKLPHLFLDRRRSPTGFSAANMNGFSACGPATPRAFLRAAIGAGNMPTCLRPGGNSSPRQPSGEYPVLGTPQCIDPFQAVVGNVSFLVLHQCRHRALHRLAHTTAKTVFQNRDDQTFFQRHAMIGSAVIVMLGRALATSLIRQ